MNILAALQHSVCPGEALLVLTLLLLLVSSMGQLQT